MKSKLAILGFVTTFSAEAFAGEITTGEFLNTAATIENKDIVINPLFGPSQVGINDDLELVSCLLCYAQVANIGTRYNLRRDEKKMMATYAWGGFEYETSAPWLFGGFTYSMATGSNWLSFDAGVGFTNVDEALGLAVVPITVSYLIPKGDRAWNIELWVDPYAIDVGDNLTLSATWHRALEKLRFGVGGTLQSTGGFLSDWEGSSIEEMFECYPLPFMLVPKAQLSFRF